MKINNVKFNWLSDAHKQQVAADLHHVLPLGLPYEMLMAVLVDVNPQLDYQGDSSNRKTISDLKEFKQIISKLK